MSIPRLKVIRKKIELYMIILLAGRGRAADSRYARRKSTPLHAFRDMRRSLAPKCSS